MPEAIILDVYGGTGGAARGYRRAGFKVIGVDIKPQPLYPGQFIQADAIEFLTQLVTAGKWYDYVNGDIRLEDIAAFHGSPPCQGFSSLATARGDGTQNKYPNLIPATRELFIESGKPYVIENVLRASLELNDPILLCGTQFGKNYQWHRLFEVNFPIVRPLCDHSITTYNPFTTAGFNKMKADFGNVFPGPEARFRLLKGIDWTLNQKEGREALPPIYTAYIGEYLSRYLTEDEAA